MHVLEILFGFNGINKTSEQLPLWFGRQRAAGAASHGPARVTPRKDSGAWTGRRHVLKEIEFTGCQLTGTEGITAACWHSEGARGTGAGGAGATHVALERLLPGVRPAVLLQAALLAEGLATLRARVRLLLQAMGTP